MVVVVVVVTMRKMERGRRSGNISRRRKSTSMWGAPRDGVVSVRSAVGDSRQRGSIGAFAWNILLLLRLHQIRSMEASCQEGKV